MKKIKKSKLSFILTFILSLLLTGFAHAGTTELVSVSSSGEQGNFGADRPAISSDGRFVCFASESSNLVANDTNGFYDIFVHDNISGNTERVSVSNTGDEGNNASAPSFWSGASCSITPDGRYVAFLSLASNLVADDTNNWFDVFVRDRQTGTTERVSISSSGEEQIFRPGDRCWDPDISDDGRFVTFMSSARNLVPNDTNESTDIFVHDRTTKTTERVSISSSGAQATGNSGATQAWSPSISGDGRYVAFASYFTNLIDNDTNDRVADIFVHDRLTGVTECVSVSSNGIQGNGPSYHPQISENGRFVSFESSSYNLTETDTNVATDIFVHDRQTGITELVSVDSSGQQGGSSCGSRRSSISDDGRYVTFRSACALVNEGSDFYFRFNTYFHDRVTKKTERVNVSNSGILGQEEEFNKISSRPSISSNGQHINIAFFSRDETLVPYDTNLGWDVFIRTVEIDTTPPTITAIIDPLANSNDWHKTNVTVKFTCEDTESEIAECTPPVTITTECTGQVVTGTALNNVGLTASTSVTINIDKTPPATSITLTGELGQNGWYKSDVQVTLTATDNQGGSGIAKTEYSLDNEVTWNLYSSPFIVSSEGINNIKYKSTDKADNLENINPLEIKIDKTAPQITINTPADGALYSLNQTVLANWSVVDPVSGVATTTPPNGSPIDTASIGVKTFSVSATDNAGNQADQTVTYFVHYVCGGILQPINADGSSIFKGGRSVPVKFQLTDATGGYVTDAVAHLYYAKTSDGVTGTEEEAPSTSSATEGNQFRYDATNNQYIFNLDIKTLTEGTWQIRAELDDGTSQYATFSVR